MVAESSRSKYLEAKWLAWKSNDVLPIASSSISQGAEEFIKAQEKKNAVI